MPIKKLVFLFAVGRLPAVIVTNYVGQGIGDGDWTSVFIISAIAVVIFVLAYWKKDLIMEKLGAKKAQKRAQQKVASKRKKRK